VYYYYYYYYYVLLLSVVVLSLPVILLLLIAHSAERGVTDDLVVELERMQKVVERMEVSFLQMISDDGDCTAINAATSQQTAVWSHV